MYQLPYILRMLFSRIPPILKIESSMLDSITVVLMIRSSEGIKVSLNIVKYSIFVTLNTLDLYGSVNALTHYCPALPMTL